MAIIHIISTFLWSHPIVSFLLFIVFATAVLRWQFPNRAYGTIARPDLPVADGALPIIGHLAMMKSIKSWTHEWFLEQAEKHGPCVRITMPGLGIGATVDAILVTDVQDMEHIYKDPWLFVKGPRTLTFLKDLVGIHGIFTADGDHWKTQRKTSAKIFSVGAFKEFYSPIFESDSLKVLQHLRNASVLGAAVDLQELLSRSTLDSFGKTATGQTFGCLDEKPVVVNGKYTLPMVPYGEAFDHISQVVGARFGNPAWPLTEKLSGTRKKLDHWVKVTRDFAIEILQAKRKAFELEGKKQDHKDLLDYFLELQYEDGSQPDNEELVDHVLNFLAAGRDSTAQTLCWLFLEIGSRPTVRDKMREEMVRVLGPDPGPIEYDKIKELRYCTAVFYEVMRLHVILPVNGKMATDDTVLPGTGTVVKKGQRMFMASYGMGYLERVWGKDAKEFKPERWIKSDGSVIKESPYKWPAFNAGPRICLGQQMGTHQSLVLICNILRGVDLQVVNEDDPNKWAIWDKDPSKRRGRYDIQLSLAIRGGLEVKPHILNKETE